MVNKKLKTKEVIDRSFKVHGDKYDYSLVDYKNTKEKVKIICLEHGIFEQSMEKHIKRQQGCPKCVNKNVTNEEFIKKSKVVHGQFYDYSLVYYVNSLINVKIICPEHGVFEQTPKCHLKYGCKKCGIELNANNSRLNTDDFIKDSKLIHGDKYDYSLVNYITCMKKVKIVCLEHGSFEQTPNRHKSGDGCPKCSFSKGENMIYKILKHNKVKFYCEQKFDNCKSVYLLKFDFYLPEKNICIEYHGNQHFESIEYFGGIKKLNETQKRDKLKELFCKENNIGLIIIWKINNENVFVDLYENSPKEILNILNLKFKKTTSDVFYNFRELKN